MLLRGVAELAERYDDFLVDLWGVIHDGEAPYPGAVDALERLAQTEGKRVLFVTNTSRAGAAVITTLDTLGIGRHLFFDVVSSGDVTRAALAARDPVVFGALPSPPRCLHYGDDGFVPWLFELHLPMVDDVDACDLVVASGAPHDTSTLARVSKHLAAAAARGVPLVCTNPDRVIPKGESTTLGPGAVAAAYRDLGGRVFLYGKPHAPIYEEARRRLASSSAAPGRMVAIGDLVETDIAGARGAGIPSVLVTRGRSGVVESAEITPEMVIERFRW
ncbi:MAG: TIGR01459 family HAD-type hydrolase [Deltaproteobacteria bacterium]|nr:TIGR01459 family HAD-type hydrolase [Deltaproteobacteria bacterium]